MDVSPKLREFAKATLKLGFDALADDDDDPFVLVIDSDGSQHLINLVAMSGVIDGGLFEVGREVVGSFTSCRAYALVFEGHVTSNGSKRNALLAEIGRRGDAEAFVFAQKLKKDKRTKSLVRDGRPIFVGTDKHLWDSVSGNGYTEQSVYTILHSKDLAELCGHCGIFKEGKKWTSALKLLIQARKSGQQIPIIFAPAENIWELTHWGILENIQLDQEDDKWYSYVTVTDVKRIPRPRPNKTQLVVKSTGKRLPRDHIRPYVLVHTPAFLTKQKKKRKKK